MLFQNTIKTHLQIKYDKLLNSYKECKDHNNNCLLKLNVQSNYYAIQ